MSSKVAVDNENGTSTFGVEAMRELKIHTKDEDDNSE